MKMSMTKFVIEAFSADEAKQKALDYGLNIIRNVTGSWKNSDKPSIDSPDFKSFAESQFEKHKLTETTGVGLMVVLESGIKDTRKFPYEFVDNKVKGTIEKKRIFEIRLVENDKLVGQAENKSDAIRLAKKLMVTYKQDMVTKVVYRVLGDKGVAFKLKYAPSQKTTKGKYVVFGNINNSF